MSSSSSSSSILISPAEWRDLQDAFALFDTQSQGRISRAELRTALSELQHEQMQQQERHEHEHEHERTTTTTTRENGTSTLRRLLEALDRRQPPLAAQHQDDEQDDVWLTLDDFVGLMTTPDPDDPRDELHKVFDLFDTQGKGWIDAADLAAIARELGEPLSPDETAEMIQRASLPASGSGGNNHRNDSGKVTLAQFREIMCKKLFS